MPLFLSRRTKGLFPMSLCVSLFAGKKTSLGPFQLVAKLVQVLARGPENLPGTGACVGLSEPPPGLLHGWSLSFRERERDVSNALLPLALLQRNPSRAVAQDKWLLATCSLFV